MKLIHRIGITVLDKLLLALMLFLCILDITSGFAEITMDLLSMILVVVIAYAGVVVFVWIVLLFFRAEGKGVDFMKGLVSAILIWALYPKVLGILFWIVGVSVSSKVETVLLWGFIIRAFLSVWLHRRWKQVGE